MIISHTEYNFTPAEMVQNLPHIEFSEVKQFCAEKEEHLQPTYYSLLFSLFEKTKSLSKHARERIKEFN